MLGRKQADFRMPRPWVIAVVALAVLAAGLLYDRNTVGSQCRRHLDQRVEAGELRDLQVYQRIEFVAECKRQGGPS